jgi:hypothetical protein
MAPVAVALVVLAALTAAVSALVAYCEPAAGGLDSSYRRLDGGAGAVAASSTQQQHQQVAALAAMEEGEGGSIRGGHGPAAVAEAIEAAEWEAAQHNAHVHVTRIPARYVKGCDGDMEEAARRWKETLAW